MIRSPFSALDAQDSKLNSPPPSLEPLQTRLCELYGTRPEELVVTRGASHALEILLRRQRINGFDYITARDDDYIEALARVYNLELKTARDLKSIRSGGLCLIDNPSFPSGKAMDLIEARTLAVEIYPALLVIDESYIDACPDQSLLALVRSENNVVILKSLSYLYGLGGARIGALIGHPKLLVGLMRYVEPNPVPTPSIRAAERALSASRMMGLEARIETIESEKSRLRETLSACGSIQSFELNDAPYLCVTPLDSAQCAANLTRFGIDFKRLKDQLVIGIGEKAFNTVIERALGLPLTPQSTRQGRAIRDTKETRITVDIDLDQSSPISINTGNGFFDHMLDQVATHGGFSLRLSCEGDHHIDAHHSIEDCMLAFGSALKLALGDRIGMARFGFTLPMDETLASVAIDLGGRPFIVFEGSFEAPLLGDYPTQMTKHAFRSLSETLGAAIHVEVKGENDHHKTEACFKALGRALRQAVRIEGNALPSTKGLLA